MNLRILSLNTFGAPFLSKNISKRFEHLADALKEEDPDVICLQEVFLYPHFHLLRVLLPEYPYTAFKRFLYGPKGGLVIFSKLPLQKSTYKGFSDRGSLRSSSIAAHLIRNGVLSVQVKDTAITVLNTHLTPNTDIDWDVNNRFSKYQASQLKQVADMVQNEKLKGREAILTGDFNIPPDSELYENFIMNSQMVDLFANMDSPTYHDSFYPDDKDARRIDYIFIPSSSKNIRHISSEYILEKPVMISGDYMYLSDHKGVMTELEINPAKQKRKFTN